MISAEDSLKEETFHAGAGHRRPRVSAHPGPGSCPCAACACILFFILFLLDNLFYFVVPVAVLQLCRQLRGRVRGEVGEAAHALGPRGAGQRPRGRPVLRQAGLVSFHPLNVMIIMIPS